MTVLIGPDPIEISDTIPESLVNGPFDDNRILFDLEAYKEAWGRPQFNASGRKF